MHTWNVSVAVWQKAEIFIWKINWECLSFRKVLISFWEGGDQLYMTSWIEMFALKEIYSRLIWLLTFVKLHEKRICLDEWLLWTLLIIVHVTASLWHSAFYLQAEKPLMSTTELLPMSWEALLWTEKRYLYFTEEKTIVCGVELMEIRILTKTNAHCNFLYVYKLRTDILCKKIIVWGKE